MDFGPVTITTWELDKMWGGDIQDDTCWYWGTEEPLASEAEAYAACADFMLRNGGADMRRQYLRPQASLFRPGV